ncbi:MAG: BamA/TamA family outer membrane protein [Ignavibacterium sp.]|nr:BamA/TamA family outer membrane protein [Ignavibacterium sp.]MDW8375043.1 BamA/TamA family outer membrane protein [Ignavibacteriales bacterium]
MNYKFRIIKLFFIIIFFLYNTISYSQYYFFGRNKVQYEDFDWKIIRTNHFNIYYYGNVEKIAEIGAAYAEEVYEELKIKLNHVVTRKIPLIFYNTSLHFQQTNITPGLIPEGVGGFFEFLKGRVVLPSNGSLSEFRHVIRHELVHVFMTNKIFRVLRDHRLPTDAMPPLWFVEGLAEYLSTEVDAQAEMVMRDAVINNYFSGMKDFPKIYGTYLMYKAGQSFLEFVEKRYGADKIPQILDNFWMFKKFDDILEYTLGESVDKIDSEWNYELKKKYFPLLAHKKPQEVASEKLTESGFNFSPVYYQKSDSSFIYFNGNRDGYSSIYRLTLYNNKELPKVDLVLRGEKTDQFESFHLFQSSIDINKNGLLTFVTKSGATDVIHFFDIKTKLIQKTFQNDNLISISSPKFSKNGDRIVFQAIDTKGYSDLYIYQIDNDSLIRLTNDYYDDRDPCFGFADENCVIFSSDRTAGKYKGKYNIFFLEIDTRDIRYLTYANANFYNPVLSPSESFLVFTSDLDTVRNIWKQNIINKKFSKTIHQISKFYTSAFDPRFINDSTLVFTGFQNFSFHIYKKQIPPDSLLDVSVIMETNSAKGKWTADLITQTGEFEKLEYEREYALDYAQSVVATDPVYGTRGGGILTISDLLGNDQYYILLYNTAEVQSDFLKSFNISLTRINLGKRVNYGYGIFHFNGRRYDIRESDTYFYEKSHGGVFLLSYPLSKFHRIEASTSIADTEREIVEGISERKAFILSNSISVVHDNSLWVTSGPVDGTRWLMLLGYTTDIRYSNVNYYSVILDYRQYVRLDLRTAIAFRAAIFYNDGKDARRYFMGGSWDLRGWNRWSIRGEKMWLSSLEFRFPLVDELLIKFPIINLGFNGIRAATFFDVGSAWDKQYKTTYGSIGFGFRFNLWNVLILRYDIGKKIEKHFTRLQPGWFYQFFFGWDF